MRKTRDNRAWFLVLPVLLLVAFSAIIPLMTVVNYSVQDIFSPGNRVFVGAEWYREALRDPRLHDALWRQFAFSGLVLLIQIPLGVATETTHFYLRALEHRGGIIYASPVFVDVE